MIDTEMPTTPSASPLARGFAACLASVTEVPATELPLPAGDLHQALGAWRSWLAGHGSGLVPIADPTGFQWAGWWIAVVRTSGGDGTGAGRAEVTEAATLAFGTPPGIVLSPQDPALLGRATADLPITAAYAVASLDPVLRPAPAISDLHGTVEGLAVAPPQRLRCDCSRSRPPAPAGVLTATGTPPVPAPSAPAATPGPATT